jgi:EAL domain-containing protein (putative c-di-GMP-specific phosphodiesterase class I)
MSQIPAPRSSLARRLRLPQAAGLSMSVNVSARQLQDASVVEDVESALRETGLDPGSLIPELTESAVVENIEGASATLQKLRWMSVQLAMDDFGTGYSCWRHCSRRSTPPRSRSPPGWPACNDRPRLPCS